MECNFADMFEAIVDLVPDRVACIVVGNERRTYAELEARMRQQTSEHVAAARSVDEKPAYALALGGRDRVVRHRRRVRVIGPGDHRHPQAGAPEFELLNGGGAKSVARCKHGRFAPGLD